jgi:cytoskeleton protein RodZ
MAGQQGQVDVGGMLRRARERRGLSLREISSATKIAMPTLEAIERNDIARLPGGIFSRGFVRSYAIEVGLEPEVVIQAFIGQFPHDSVTAGHPATSRIEDHEAVESDRRVASTLLRLLAISVPLAAVAVYLTAAGRRVPDVRGQQTAVSTPQAAVSAPPSSADVPLPAAVAVLEPVATAPADRLTVQVSATRRSWVGAIVDGARAAQREFRPGEEARFEVRRDIVLTAGDAGGVAVMFNGMPARPLGGSGEVVTVRVNLNNFRNYLLTP